MIDFKRLADCIYGILDTNKREPLTAEQCKALDEVHHVITTFANACVDEPDSKTFSPDISCGPPCVAVMEPDASGDFVTSDYAYWQRNGRLRAELRVKELEQSNAYESFHDKAHIAELEKENEQLKQQLSAKDGALFAYQKIISKLQAGIDAALSATVASPEDKHVTTLESIVTQAITQQGEV